MSVLGDRIKKEREKLNLTREDLAKEIGVSYSTIAMYEQGNREPNNELTIKMCELFDCTVDYLLGKSYYRNYKDFQKIDEFVLNYKRTPEETKVVCDTLNYTNTHPNETFEEILERFTHDVPIDKKELLKAIISHLHYRYHGKTPKEFGVENLNRMSVKDVNNSLVKRFSGNIISIPVVGKIAAGQPILADEHLEGALPVDLDLYGLKNAEDLFFLRVSGQSMNLKVKNGDFALIHKQDYAENGDIVVAIVNGDDEATLKKFKKLNEQFVLLEPMSSDPTIEAITVNLKDTNFKIIGKAIGQFGKF